MRSNKQPGVFGGTTRDRKIATLFAERALPMTYLLRSHYSYWLLMGLLLAATGCASAPTSADSPEAIAALDAAWTVPHDEICTIDVGDDVREEFGPPKTGMPGFWPLVYVSDQMPADDEIADWYDELCDAGDGAACTLRALLEFFPAEAEGSRDGDPHAVADHLGVACGELGFGPACPLLVEYTQDHISDEELGDLSRGDMAFHLLWAGCAFGDGISCYLLSDGFDTEEANAEYRGLRDFVLSRACHQDHAGSCFRLGWTALQERDDLPCALATMRAGCEKGSQQSCAQVENITGQICDQSDAQAPVFCDGDADELLDDSRPPMLAWHTEYIERCDDGDHFACHVAGRALFSGDDGHYDLSESSRLLAKTCSGDQPFDCGVAAGATMSLYDPDDGIHHLQQGFAFAKQGCLGGDRPSCDLAVDLLFSGRAGISNAFEIDEDSEHQIAAKSCQMGIETACMTLVGRLGQDLDDEDRRDYAQRFGDNCKDPSSLEDGSEEEIDSIGLACMIAAIALDGIDTPDSEDEDELEHYMTTACDAGVTWTCLEDADADEVALQELMPSGGLNGYTPNGQPRPMPDTDCIDPADQPTDIECSSHGGQRLSSEEWGGRYGCGITDITELETSPEQPVEVCRLEGQHQFLSQLTCADGSSPYSGPREIKESRAGNIGEAGRCDEVVDLYEVPCPEGTYEVYVDLYFCPE